MRTGGSVSMVALQNKAIETLPPMDAIVLEIPEELKVMAPVLREVVDTTMTQVDETRASIPTRRYEMASAAAESKIQGRYLKVKDSLH